MARVALSRITQDRGEPVRAFTARIRGQAEVCRFVKACTGCDRLSNQGEERVADQLSLLEYLDLKRSKNDQNRCLDGVLNQSSGVQIKT